MMTAIVPLGGAGGCNILSVNSQKFVPRPVPCAEEFRKLRYEGVFTPPSVEGTLVFPGNVGGANWGSGAYDASRGLIFVAANRLATAVRLIPRSKFSLEARGEPGERWGQEYASQAARHTEWPGRRLWTPKECPATVSLGERSRR
jgi:glucose dehydrogenase